MAETSEEAAVSEPELAPRHSIEDMMRNMDIINDEIKLIRFISLKITTAGIRIWFVEMKLCCLSDYYHEYPIRKTKRKKRQLDPSQG